MRKIVELRNEGRLNFNGDVFFIDPERVDCFTIHEADPERLPDLQHICFYKDGRAIACATVYGRKRAEEYALKVVNAQEGGRI